MEILELKAQPRQETGKSRARQLRVAGRLPANVYGQETDSIPLTIDSRDFSNVIRSQAGTHVIIKLLIDGTQAPTVIVKEVQRHPVRQDVLHVDFLSVALNEKIVAAVPINLVGDSVGAREGGLLQHGSWEVQIEALPMDLPDHLEIDISDLAIGDSLHASDISLPAALTLASAADDVIATVLPPVVYKEEAAEEEAVVEEGPAPRKEEAPSEGSEGS